MDHNLNAYKTNFLLSIPKKQAKSYEIDLGQNNGAYDEELLIRYGDNTLNHMKNKNRGTNLNMDDILKMNEQLRPFQEKQLPQEGVVSFKEMCESIEEKMFKFENDSKYLDDFEKKLNKAVEVMTNDIFKFFDDTYNQFNPELLEKYNYLKSKIKEQKDENANLLKQIDFLLQENTQIMDMVYKVGSRLKKLETRAGIDKKELPNESKMSKGMSEEGSGSNLRSSQMVSGQVKNIGEEEGQIEFEQNEEMANEEDNPLDNNIEVPDDGEEEAKEENHEGKILENLMDNDESNLVGDEEEDLNAENNEENVEENVEENKVENFEENKEENNEENKEENVEDKQVEGQE